MIAIAYIGYTLLTLYLLYCISFCCMICATIISENRDTLFRYIPLRNNNEIEITQFEFVNEHKLETIYEY